MTVTFTYESYDDLQQQFKAYMSKEAGILLDRIEAEGHHTVKNRNQNGHPIEIDGRQLYASVIFDGYHDQLLRLLGVFSSDISEYDLP